MTRPATDTRGTGSDGAGSSAGRAGGAAPGETGSVTLFVLGFCVVLLLALAGVTVASSVYIARRSLTSVADGAAVAAADALSDADVLAGLPADQVGLDPGGAAQAAATSVAQSGAPTRFTGFGWDAGLDDAGLAVVVTVRADAPVPLATRLFGTRIRVTVRARATAAG